MHETTTTRPFQRKRLGRSLAVVISAAGLLAAGIFYASTANAATEVQNFTLTGSITIGTLAPITLPAGSGFSATIDTTTGDITNGTSSIPVIHIPANPPAVPVAVDITITDAAPATGTLDLVTGLMNLSSHYTITLTVPPSINCTVGPVEPQLSTDGNGGSDLTGNPATATLTDSGFSVPAVAGTGEAGACPDGVAALVNATLGTPTESSNLVLTITQTETPVTTSTTTTAAVTPTTAKAAAAGGTNAAPSFTG